MRNRLIHAYFDVDKDILWINSLMETVHLLRSPANAAHLARSIAQFQQGKTIEQSLDDAG